ncbi:MULTISPECIES: serine hydrolase [unclassified Oleiphilus]|nr:MULTISPECIES: serine hydrolase [unclassified Oleiphilus]
MHTSINPFCRAFALVFLTLSMSGCLASDKTSKSQAETDRTPEKTAVVKSKTDLNAATSDPNQLGLMQGFPPPDDKLVMQPQSNYFSFPNLRWTVCHIRELLPTKQISRGLAAPHRFEYALDDRIDSLRFTPLGSNKSMTWKESLSANYTDGIVVLHQGKIVYEQYRGCLDEDGKHAAMSMTKSFTGLIAEMLIAEGLLDDRVAVASIVPELKDSAFGDATVRQVMDMTTALQYSEDYADPKADIWLYSAAASPMPKPANYKGPNGYYEYLQTVQKAGKHGDAFAYKTINTDALGWIVSRATNTDLAKLISEKLWKKLGAEQDAYMTVDAKGTPFAGGGISAGLRDLARLGQALLNDGEFNGQGIFPASVAQSIRNGADKNVFAKAGYNTMQGGSYRSMWWHFHNEFDAYAARGVHGQTIYIAPKADMVIVRFSSFPTAKNAKIDPTSLPAYEALASYLSAKQIEIYKK